MAKFLEFLYKILKYFIKRGFEINDGQAYACEEVLYTCFQRGILELWMLN